MQRSLLARARPTARRRPSSSTGVAAPSPTCPACASPTTLTTSAIPLRALSVSAVASPPIPTTSASSSSNNVRLNQLSSWSKSLFGDDSENQPASTSNTTSYTASPSVNILAATAAADLAAELSFANPDPARVWNLFSQIDLHGATGQLLSPKVLHKVLAALHTPATAAQQTDVHAATAAARAYALKADLVLLRLRRAGAVVQAGDLKALGAQYLALSYAPGAVQVWSDLRAGGLTSPVAHHSVLDAMYRWIKLHQATGGRALSRAAAEPLVNTAIAVLDAMDPRSASSKSLEYFFQIMVAAARLDVFSVAMKAVYGYDLAYPGAEIDGTEAERAKWRPFGEKQVLWVLEMLAAKDQLSSMISTLEVFDTPSSSLAPLLGNRFSSFFTAGSSTSSRRSVSSQPTRLPSLVSSGALVTLMEKAIEMDKGAVARHYFSVLYERWLHSSHERLVGIESAAGITFVPKPPRKLEEEREAFELGEEGAELSAEENGAAASISDTPVLSSANMTAVDLEPPASSTPRAPAVTHTHTSAPIVNPLRPYYVSSQALIRLARTAKSQNDFVTTRFLRHRITKYLQEMRIRIERLKAVCDAIEPSNAWAALPKSIRHLHSELAMTKFHNAQIQLVYERIKLDSSIALSYQYTRNLASHRSEIARRLQDEERRGEPKRVILSSRVTLRRLERRAMLARATLLRQRIMRLQQLGKATPDGYEYKQNYGELMEIRRKLRPSTGAIAFKAEEGGAPEGVEAASA